MNREITKIIRQYPKTDDCKFQTLGELHKWQIREITELIKQAEDEERERCAKKYNDSCTNIAGEGWEQEVRTSDIEETIGYIKTLLYQHSEYKRKLLAISED